MEVPLARRNLQVEAPGVAAPTIRPVGPESFGANLGQAKAQLGQEVMGAAQKLGQYIEKRDNFDKEQAVHDALQPVQQEMYSKTQGKEGYATLQGLQSKGATDKFTSEFLPKKTEFLKQFKDERQAALASAQYDSIYNNHLNSVISNEGKQTSVMEQQGLASAAQTAAQAAAVDPKTMPADNPVWNAAVGRAKDYYASIYGEEAAKLEVQKLNTMAAMERVKLHPEDADKVMAMDLSPEGKAQVRGVQLDQMVKKDYSSLGKEYRMPDGSFNLDKVEKRYKEDKTLNNDEAQKSFDNFASMENRAERILVDENKANSAKFYDVASNPKTDLEVARKSAVLYADKLRNGQADHRDIATKLKFIEQINKEANGTTDPETFNALYQGIDKDGSVTAEQIVEARNNGSISRTAMQSLTQFLYGQRSEVMTNRMKIIEESGLVPTDPDEKKKFMAALKQEALSRRIVNPDDLQKLAQSMSANAPTGNASFWGKLFKSDQPLYKSVGVMSQHPEIIRAAGGSPQKAAEFAARVGGVEKFGEQGEYTEAVSYLLGKGWTLDNMTADALSKVAARLAEKKK